MTSRNDVEQRARTIDDLVRRLESQGDAGLRASARELVQAILEFHAAGLTRVMELVDDAGAPGAALIDRFGQDELIKPLLLLHGLHPLSLRARVVQALDETRALLLSHGSEVELVGVDEAGVVTLRLDSLSPDGRRGSSRSTPGTLKVALEDALREAAPDITRLVVEGATEPPGAMTFVPVGELRRNRTVAGSVE
jgi:Fe-S cluster biogenesis protein NfuA